MAKTVAFKSWGCKLNQYEVQALREGFLRHGFSEVPPTETADYYVLNTCTVTQQADVEARDFIRSCNRKHPDAQIVVTGCYATAAPEEVKNLPGVRLVADNQSKNQILFQITGSPETSEEESPFFAQGISYFEERSRAFVKVQDGCNYFCAFCKIPYVRGRLVSRNETAVLNEVRRLIDFGYQEIVLSGVCLGSYGKDTSDDRSLAKLIRKIIALPGKFRIRLSSIDPRDTPLELAEIMAESPKLCPHLHLSLQSGDDKILSRMRRGYTTAEFETQVGALRKIVPDIGFSTDVIVGFPGEDEASFENTQRFLEKIEFHKVHVFPYSEREKTKAVHLDEKIQHATVKARARALSESLRPVTERFLERFIGKELEILVEGQKNKDGFLEGFSENYIRCVFLGSENWHGKTIKVKTVEIKNQKLFCSPTQASGSSLDPRTFCG